MFRFARAFLSDCRRWSLPVAMLRALRCARAWRMGAVHRRLQSNAAYRMHVAKVAPHDPWFYLSHRHYLARGLTAGQRVKAALAHYEHELARFDAEYFKAVYLGAGLELWRAETAQGVFDIRLQPGNDVLYEGGVSLVVRCDGQRIGVMSYSTLDAALLLPAGAALPPGPLLYVTRKQSMHDRGYQDLFNKAFDRTTVGHICFAALEGVAMAQGHRQVMAITPQAHPACTPALQESFRVAYTQFWQTLMARESSPFGCVIDLPMRLTPLEALDTKQRKRATARRAHLEAVRASAHEAIRRRLAPPVREPAVLRRPRALASPRTLVFCALMAIG